MQRVPAGFPFGIPGMGVLIDGAIQQAPQPMRHFIRAMPLVSYPSREWRLLRPTTDLGPMQQYRHIGN